MSARRSPPWRHLAVVRNSKPTTAVQRQQPHNKRLAGSLSLSQVHKQAKLAAIGGGFVPEFFERVEKDQKVRNTRKLGEEVGHMCRWGFLGVQKGERCGIDAAHVMERVEDGVCYQ